MNDTAAALTLIVTFCAGFMVPAAIWLLLDAWRERQLNKAVANWDLIATDDADEIERRICEALHKVRELQAAKTQPRSETPMYDDIAQTIARNDPTDENLRKWLA